MNATCLHYLTSGRRSKPAPDFVALAILGVVPEELTMTYPDWLDHPLISERYFFPRREAVADPFPIEVAGATLACRRYLVDPQAKTLVHFHGNGEVAADYERGFPELFTRLGCNLLLAEFRGYGGSTGRPQLGRMRNTMRRRFLPITRSMNPRIAADPRRCRFSPMNGIASSSR
jgi:hypothetical protein